MSGYLLDTNIASHVIRGDRQGIGRRLPSLPMDEIAISEVTEGELRYGLAKRNYPAALTERVRQFLLRVDVLAWDRAAAQACGDLGASCEAEGVSLAPLDMMIAAHAVDGRPPAVACGTWGKLLRVRSGIRCCSSSACAACRGSLYRTRLPNARRAGTNASPRR